MSLDPLPERGAGELLLRRLAEVVALTEEERAVLPGPDAPSQSHELGAELERDGGPIATPRLIASGWACQIRVLQDGRRQILGLLVPGDCIGIPPGLRAGASTPWTTLALTRLRTIGIEPIAMALRGGAAGHGGLTEGFAAFAAIEHARLLERIVSLGRRTAVERVAHLLLELRDRLLTVGIGTAQRFPCPLTQEAMADLLGLSTVHVNRTLQQLRREHLLAMRSGLVELLDVEAMMEVADYGPLRPAPRLPAF